MFISVTSEPFFNSYFIKKTYNMAVMEEVFSNSFYRSVSGEYQVQKNLMLGVSDMQDLAYL